MALLDSRRLIFGVIFILSVQLPVYAADQYKLWQTGDIPHEKPHNVNEYEGVAWGTKVVYKVTDPTLTVYQAERNSGIMVLIMPGGGYSLEAIYHEGQDVALALNKQGINAAVLKYRIPNPKTSYKPELAPITDARQALSMLHQMADKYDVNPDKIGVMGFSAGSHLATVASVWPTEHQSERPDFSALIYGVSRLTKENQDWLEKALYFRPMTPQEVKQNTLLAQVNKATPPAFLVHSYDDDVCHVKESTEYAEQLFTHQVPVEMHLYQKGGHGYGLGRKEDGTDTWLALFSTWVKNL
ncbi:alpha/beta hydrolase [Thalassotalea agarivorans]|uniref:Acetyl esterase/lipase n=1 Tax=Thalassotalea agarivorans TaxID=349064 RepID=A0A1I0DPH0_THASX|nr:alpha/beta hydrolase [Thalassotalea agarivorans]SET34131.1 Acetyl esterase/lipase [Thalassotalea agarivorans]